MSKYKPEVGMSVFLVPTDSRERKAREYSEVFIWKVGRKWVEYAWSRNSQISNGRFDKEAFEQTGRSPVDAGGYSPRNFAYADMAIFRHEVAVSTLRSRVRNRVIDNQAIPVDQLVQIADILGVEHDLKEKSPVSDD